MRVRRSDIALMESEHPEALKYPKPAPTCRHLWRVAWKGERIKLCQKCGKFKPAKQPKPIARTPLKQSRKPIAQMSDKRRARVKGWPDFKRAIFEIHGGVCYWHKGPCSFENGTAEHLVPWNLTHRDVETLTGWICHRGFPRSCHGAKQGTWGQVIGLRYQAEFYGVAGSAPARTPDDTPRDDEAWVNERDELWRLMNRVQEEIWNGTRPSKLPARFAHLSRRPT